MKVESPLKRKSTTEKINKAGGDDGSDRFSVSSDDETAPSKQTVTVIANPINSSSMSRQSKQMVPTLRVGEVRVARPPPMPVGQGVRPKRVQK